MIDLLPSSNRTFMELKYKKAAGASNNTIIVLIAPLWN